MNVSILDSETLEKILKDSEKFEEIEKTMDLIILSILLGYVL